MTNRMKIAITLIVTSAALVSTGVMAQETKEQADATTRESAHTDKKSKKSQRRQKRRAKKLNALLDDIKATKDQRTTIKLKLAKLYPQKKAVRKNMRAQGKIIKGIILSAKPDTKKMHTTINSASASAIKNMHNSLDTMIEIHQVLTPAQRLQLAKQWDTPYRAFTGSWFIDRGLDKVLARLDATKTQRQLAETQKKAIIKSAGAMIKSLHPIRQAMIAQLKAKEVDKKAVKTLINRGALIVTQFAHDAADSTVTFTKSLSEKQRLSFNKMMTKKRRHH